MIDPLECHYDGLGEFRISAISAADPAAQIFEFYSSFYFIVWL